jgi:predicted Rossmann fold nucleotide-binding protein DprA/Smf involved in DNA uptake
MPDAVSKIRSDLEKRLRELEPLVQEHAHVREALDALKGVGARVERAATTTAKRARSAGASATAKRPGPGRPRGTGGRAHEALKLVHTHPGITIAELAKRMKIKANYLYRVLSQLQKEGKVEKRDKGYHPPAS